MDLGMEPTRSWGPPFSPLHYRLGIKSFQADLLPVYNQRQLLVESAIIPQLIEDKKKIICRLSVPEGLTYIHCRSGYSFVPI